jgi:putative redox protein
MDQSIKEPPVRRVVVRHDGSQRCTAERLPDGNVVSLDCPYTGKGEEFSPTNLVEAGLAACMLLSMGTFAQHSGLDVTGISVEVKVNMTGMANMRFDTIVVKVNMPAGLSAKDRKRLQGAAELCPIKHGFSEDVPINVEWIYPD